MAPPLIFISYSRKDSGALDPLVNQLRVLEQQQLASVWFDQRLEPGEVWQQTIGNAIERASIAILLVSEHFLGSEFILKQEVPRILERSRQGKLRVIPLLLSPCAWKTVDWLERLNLWPGGGTPLLSGRSQDQIQRELAELTLEIRTFLAKQRAPTEATPGLLQFLDFHLERIRRMDWEENWAALPDATWSEAHFTELEAEVESEHQDSRFPRLSGGLRIRRERRLARALARSREPFIVLEGAPGAGKSVVLRFVARELLKEARSAAQRAGRQPIRVALYLPLRDFLPEGKPDANAVRRFVLDSLGPDAALVADSLGRPESNLRWLFLFDAFDEIPAVLSSTQDDNTVRDYAYALNDFITRTPGASAMVGSRHFRGPTRFGWKRYRLLPLNDERRVELTKRYLRDSKRVDQVLGWLESSKNGLPVFGTSPLLLAMLCAWFEQENKSPGHPHEVFERFLDQRLSRHAGELKARGLTPGEVRSAAEALAFCMSADTRLGLEPSHAELSSALQRHALPAESLSDVLETLREIRLAKRGSTSEGQPSFAFVHRRFQEFLSTRWVQAEPNRVSMEVLLSDYRWRETCVVLLQTSSGPFFKELLARAEAMLAETLELLQASEEEEPLEDLAPEALAQPEEAELDEGVYGVWPLGTRHLLELLQEGLRERISAVPASLREKIWTLLRSAWSSASLVDRREALEVAGLAPASELEGLLIAAFDSQSEVLAEAAYMQAIWLRRLPAPVTDGIRAMLVEFERSGRLSRLWRRTQVHVSRLPDSSEFIRTVRLLQWVRPVRSVLYIAWLLASLVMASQNEPTIRRLLWSALAVFWVAVHLPRMRGEDGGGGGWSREDPNDFDANIVLRWGAESIPLLAPSVEMGVPPLAALLMTWGVISWEAYAYLACRTGRWTTAWFMYPFWFGLVRRSAWKLYGQFALVLLPLMALLSLIVLLVKWLDLTSSPIFTVIAGAAVAASLGFQFVMFKRGRPARIRRRELWKRVEQIGVESLEPEQLIHWILQFKSHEDRVRFIRLMRTRGTVRPMRIGALSDTIAEHSSEWEAEVLDELYWLRTTLQAKRGSPAAAAKR